MSENFEAIKKKILRTAIAASVVLGACCGLILTCILVVVFKACAVNFHWAIYIPIAIALSAACVYPLFLALRPNDKRVAKKLDSSLGLKQKVQTMVEFAGEDGALVEMQREQANNALASAVVPKKFYFGDYLKFLVVPIVALAMLFAGIFVPAAKSTVDPPYDHTVTKETALINLIENVQQSSLDDELKIPTVETLNGLLDALREITQQSVMKNAVISSVKIIDALFAAADSYLKINASFSGDEQLKSLGDALVNCVLFYRVGGTEINSFDAVKSKEKESDVKVVEGLNNWTTAFLKNFIDEESGDKISVAAASAKLAAFSAALAEKIEALATDDPLSVSLLTYGQSLSLLAVTTSGVSADSYYASIEGLCKIFVDSANGPTAVQSYNCMMDEYIRAELAKIFNISKTEFGSNEAVVPPANGDDDGENGNPGGWGSGDIIYGSNDLVLDVDTGEMVPYGQLLNKYNDMVNDRIASGACSEEVAKYIRQYFRILFSGIDDKS